MIEEERSVMVVIGDYKKCGGRGGEGGWESEAEFFVIVVVEK